MRSRPPHAGGRVIADTTPAGFLAETGQSDPDAAFLALVERDAADHTHQEAGIVNAVRTLATAGRVPAPAQPRPPLGRAHARGAEPPHPLFAWLFVEQDQVFQTVGPAILALFPFIVMFLITSITTCRANAGRARPSDS